MSASRQRAGAAVLLGLALLALAGCVSPDRPSLAAGGAAAPTGSAAPTTAAAPATPPAPNPADQPPAVPREFRAAWVATVANIDWPSAPGLPADAQRQEALAILDRARALRLNALILQVRPAGDAIYPSTLEPWSEFLTGRQGEPPQPPWDPLAFWVREAHLRGLELHVWFNPYRARHSMARTPLAAPHLGVRQPGVVRRYGDQLWMDPGEPAAEAHSLAVVADVVRRYDIDAVHIDDYFYPYPVAQPGVTPAPGTPAPELPFPDDESHARYLRAGGTLTRDEWRRANVDRFVQQFQATVRGLKPWVKVGISPFGIGRPDRRPAGIIGFSQYDKLHADVERWLQAGWLDYLAPQLYWPITREGQAFPVLLDYWIGQNTQRRHIWPGLFTSLVANPATRGEPLGPRNWPAREITDQLSLLRFRAEGASGHIHFSMVALMQDRDGLASALQRGLYAQPALVPASPWLDEQPPPAPTLQREAAGWRIVPGAGEAATRWVVWRRSAGQWTLALHAAHERVVASAGAERLAVAAVDRLGNLSPYARASLDTATARPGPPTP